MVDGMYLDRLMDALPLRDRALDQLGDVLLLLDEVLATVERDPTWTAEREDLTATVRSVFNALDALMRRLGN
ncbi:MAG: hypothetical protein JOZ54_10010 [Acidobacteria bacterium]|nr:hypothetical protein [Acidobacteriota bacterium]